MKKHSAFLGTAKDNNIKYILTRPSRLSELSLDDMENADTDMGWRDKSRQLQARRWRKIRHQVS